MLMLSPDCVTYHTGWELSVTPSIAACQAEGTTPYCYPPNGTRVCVPAMEIPVFWPPGYYNSASGIATSWSSKVYDFTTQQNNGTGPLTRQNISAQLYKYIADEIPGVANEKTLTMYFWEEVPDGSGGFENGKRHEGPTLTLVKPFDVWPTSSTVSSTTTRSASSSPTSHNLQNDEGPHHPPKVIAGIVLGAIVGAILIGALCFTFCCSCCCQQKREEGRVRRQQLRNEQCARDVEKLAGAAVGPFRGNTASIAAGGDDSSAVEAQRVEQRRQEIGRSDTTEPPIYEPPPKYTP
jgi:hypothetical protein